MKVAALCAGYSGLELGLQMAGVDVKLAWYAEVDKHASQVLAAHHGDVPNLGDLTEITGPEPVDLVAAGFPCQPVSLAGKRRGVNDERWLIDDVCRVASEARADWLILENVSGLLSANGGDAMARVVSGLAAGGFAAEWMCVRASDVGAPHQRLRWFCIGYTDSVAGHTPVARDRGPEQVGEPRTVQRTVGPNGAFGGTAPADADSQGPQGRPAMRQRGNERPAGSNSLVAWGPYADAIARWEPIVGRPAPEPTDDKRRLNPRFLEWMMGLPDGWVCDHVDGRSHQLRILGNGVVPQQAGHAIRHLLQRIEVAS